MLDTDLAPRQRLSNSYVSICDGEHGDCSKRKTDKKHSWRYLQQKQTKSDDNSQMYCRGRNEERREAVCPIDL